MPLLYQLKDPKTFNLRNIEATLADPKTFVTAYQEETRNIYLHIGEIQLRVLLYMYAYMMAFFTCVLCYDQLLHLLTYLIIGYNKIFVYHTITEPVFVFFRVCFLCSIFSTFPFFIYNLHTYYSKIRWEARITLSYIYGVIHCILFIILFGITMRYILTGFIEYCINFNMEDQIIKTNTKILLNAKAYIDFIFKNILFVIFFCSLPWIYKLLKRLKLLPWGDLTWDVKYFDKRFRYHMYLGSIGYIILWSPPEFLYHFFGIPIGIFFMEIYFITFYFIWCIQYLAGLGG